MDETDLVEQADADALLMMEAWTLGLHNPVVWDNYVEGWEEDVIRRSDRRFGRNQPPDGGSPDG